MSHDIYVFGSAVRGEVDQTSDIDILVIPLEEQQLRFPKEWSVYSPQILQEYFSDGRLFAWHLYLESKCIHSANGTPYLEALGEPSPYSTVIQDINELEELYMESIKEMRSGTNSLIYELGIAYTAIRDIGMSASWALMERPCFSRNAPYLLPLPCPVPVPVYRSSMLARHSSTRGVDSGIDGTEISQALLQVPVIKWIQSLRNAI